MKYEFDNRTKRSSSITLFALGLSVIGMLFPTSAEVRPNVLSKRLDPRIIKTAPISDPVLFRKYQVVGRVLDPSIVSQVILEWRAAAIALNSSRQDYERTLQLFQKQKSVSEKSLQLSEALWRKDEALERILKGRMSDLLGTTLFVPGEESKFVDSLLDRNSSLLQFDIPSELDANPVVKASDFEHLKVKISQYDFTEKSCSAEVISQSLARDPVTRIGYWYVLLPGHPYLINSILLGSVDLKVDNTSTYAPLR